MSMPDYVLAGIVAGTLELHGGSVPGPKVWQHAPSWVVKEMRAKSKRPLHDLSLWYPGVFKLSQNVLQCVPNAWQNRTPPTVEDCLGAAVQISTCKDGRMALAELAKELPSPILAEVMRRKGGKNGERSAENCLRPFLKEHTNVFALNEDGTIELNALEVGSMSRNGPKHDKQHEGNPMSYASVAAKLTAENGSASNGSRANSPTSNEDEIETGVLSGYIHRYFAPAHFLLRSDSQDPTSTPDEDLYFVSGFSRHFPESVTAKVGMRVTFEVANDIPRRPNRVAKHVKLDEPPANTSSNGKKLGNATLTEDRDSTPKTLYGELVERQGFKWYIREDNSPTDCPRESLFFVVGYGTHFPESRVAEVGMRVSFVRSKASPKPNPIATNVRLIDGKSRPLDYSSGVNGVLTGLSTSNHSLVSSRQAEREQAEFHRSIICKIGALPSDALSAHSKSGMMILLDCDSLIDRGCRDAARRAGLKGNDPCWRLNLEEIINIVSASASDVAGDTQHQQQQVAITQAFSGSRGGFASSSSQATSPLRFNGGSFNKDAERQIIRAVSADIGAILCKQEMGMPKVSRVYAIVACDATANYSDVVKLALGEGFHVIFWCWSRSAVPMDVSEAEGFPSGLTVKYLDAFVPRFSISEISTASLDASIVRKRAIVFRIPASAQGIHANHSIAQTQLIHDFLQHIQYKFDLYSAFSAEASSLFVMMAITANNIPESTLMEIFQEAQQSIESSPGLQVFPWESFVASVEHDKSMLWSRLQSTESIAQALADNILGGVRFTNSGKFRPTVSLNLNHDEFFEQQASMVNGILSSPRSADVADSSSLSSTAAPSAVSTSGSSDPFRIGGLSLPNAWSDVSSFQDSPSSTSNANGHGGTAAMPPGLNLNLGQTGWGSGDRSSNSALQSFNMFSNNVSSSFLPARFELDHQKDHQQQQQQQQQQYQHQQEQSQQQPFESNGFSQDGYSQQQQQDFQHYVAPQQMQHDQSSQQQHYQMQMQQFWHQTTNYANGF